jgi:3',5'-cyclic AMP phosphodiesterase CpdA
MKHLIIGDLHGRDCWQDIDMKKYDKVVFLGDYVDSFTLPDDAIYDNLNNLIELKMRYWNRLILLLGNHDVQYRYFPRYQIKGFRPSMQQRLTGLFYRYWGCFQMAYQCGEHIFTHAGITNAWYDDFLRSPVLSRIDPGKLDVAGIINTVAAMVNPMDRYLLYAEGIYRGVPGDMGNGSPIWADRKETMFDMLLGYHQVVGHTCVPEPDTVRFTDRSVTYIDVLDHLTYFHEVEC